jgi:DNA uptake protein ComE-like DNA-binding protein
VLLILAFVAVAACSSGDNKAADTTAVAADTSTMSATTTTTTPATSSTTASAAAIVPININTATDAQILAIPGVGPRMLREFKEYRPYTSIEQFRREIGKYVDKAEVARLEQYIVIK